MLEEVSVRVKVYYIQCHGGVTSPNTHTLVHGQESGDTYTLKTLSRARITDEIIFGCFLCYTSFKMNLLLTLSCTAWCFSSVNKCIRHAFYYFTHALNMSTNLNLFFIIERRREEKYHSLKFIACKCQIFQKMHQPLSIDKKWKVLM